MEDYQIILEKSAFARKQVLIKTKERGTIVGTFTGVDEFETDPERLGFCIDISEHEYDVVFPDEITAIEVLEKAPLKLAVGK